MKYLKDYNQVVREPSDWENQRMKWAEDIATLLGNATLPAGTVLVADKGGFKVYFQTLSDTPLFDLLATPKRVLIAMEPGSAMPDRMGMKLERLSVFNKECSFPTEGEFKSYMRKAQV